MWEFDLFKSTDPTVKTIFGQLLHNLYPAGSYYQKFSRTLIADELIESRPNPFSTRYHVPKWIIPSSSITTIKLESSDSKCFSIVTDQNQYRFRAPVIIADRWIELLTRMGNVEMQCSTRGLSAEEIKLNKFVARQKIWKNVLGELIKKQPKAVTYITTLFPSEYGFFAFILGIQEIKGLKNQPLQPLPDQGRGSKSETTAPSLSDNSVYSYLL
jgi:hypothetical protein